MLQAVGMGGTPTPTVAARVGVSIKCCYRRLSCLQAWGLVWWMGVPGDHRPWIVLLTPAGRAAARGAPFGEDVRHISVVGPNVVFEYQ